uniref:SLV.7 n=1 Tax=Streptomyces lavendulae TaxID=1914 RepID=Q6RGR3_STRLA|nr:SLV.7 [Streptomyces lavendulae]
MISRSRRQRRCRSGMACPSNHPKGTHRVMTATDIPDPVTVSRTMPVWPLWLLTMTFFSTTVGMSAGLVESLASAGLPSVIRAVGTGFLSAAGLCLTAVPVVLQLRKRS